MGTPNPIQQATLVMKSQINPGTISCWLQYPALTNRQAMPTTTTTKKKINKGKSRNIGVKWHRGSSSPNRRLQTIQWKHRRTLISFSEVHETSCKQSQKTVGYPQTALSSYFFSLMTFVFGFSCFSKTLRYIVWDFCFFKFRHL